VINSVDQSSTIPNQSPITCPLCDAFFLFEEEKTNHLLTVHSMRIEEAPTKTFEVTDDKVCQYCNKAFSKPSMLIRHMRVHTGEKPFTCKICLKSFNQKNALQIHQQSKHEGDKPYTCPFCSYPFTQKGNLKTHIQRSHQNEAKLLLASQPQA